MSQISEEQIRQAIRAEEWNRGEPLSKSKQKRIAAQTEKVNPLPAMSDDDLLSELRKYDGEQGHHVTAAIRDICREYIARYDSVKRDLRDARDYSEI